MSVPGPRSTWFDQVLSDLSREQAGQLVALEDADVIAAFSSGSVLGTLYAIEKTVPVFADRF